jgi:hypothetical protein
MLKHKDYTGFLFSVQQLFFVAAAAPFGARRTVRRALRGCPSAPFPPMDEGGHQGGEAVEVDEAGCVRMVIGGCAE